MTVFDPLKDKLASDYIDIMRFSEKKQAEFEAMLHDEVIPAEILNISQSGERIGYFVRTCCPFTPAEIELAQQAIQVLNLDKLVFIIWPFRYLHGYHSTSLENQAIKHQPAPWEERMEILHHVLATVNDNKLTILEASKDWYMQSEIMHDENESMNPFWTGTWYVIRKLQYFLNQTSAQPKQYFYCCSEDQFNPNIYPLIKQGQEKIWKDYSIMQQLAIHHVFVVPTGSAPLHNFVAPNWSHHKVFFGAPLKSRSQASTAQRTNKTLNIVNVGCVGGVASYLVRMGIIKTPPHVKRPSNPPAKG